MRCFVVEFGPIFELICMIASLWCDVNISMELPTGQEIHVLAFLKSKTRRDPRCDTMVTHMSLNFAFNQQQFNLLFCWHYIWMGEFVQCQ